MKKIILFSFLLLTLIFTACKTDTNSSTAETEEGISKEWPYFAQEDKIRNYLTVDEIPEDFPKHYENENYEEYFTRCAEWAKNNLEKIKPEFKDKVTNYQGNKK